MHSQATIQPELILEAPRQIPLIHQVDVAVLGGSGGAVAAAVAAARAGAKVFLAAPWPYLGDDIAGALRLWAPETTPPPGTLAAAFYAMAGAAGLPLPTPLMAKKFFDEALLGAGILFMTGCAATEVLLDADGRVGGVVLANRSGRQAVRAKVVIDATPSALLARQAGARCRPFEPGVRLFSQTVVSGSRPAAPGMEVIERSGEYQIKIGGPWAAGLPPANGMPEQMSVRLYECRLPLHLPGSDPFTLAAACQEMRDRIFTAEQQDSGHSPAYVAPESIFGVAATAAWRGGAAAPLDACRPLGVEGIFVLGTAADFSRDAAAALLEPANLMELGERLGAAAAAAAAGRSHTSALRVENGRAGAIAEPAVEIRELLNGLLPNAVTASGFVREEGLALPVFAECDVLVAGGGTSGAPAAIAAARRGRRTVLCEYYPDLGGTTTVGVLARYFHGNHCGFTAEMDAPVQELAANINQGKAEWLRRECRRAGVRLLTGSLAAGALIRNSKLEGLVVVTPDGRRGVIRAKVVIDATGNADVAAAAGAPTVFIGAAELSLQGASMNRRRLGSNTENTDIGFVDDTDAWDMSFFPLRARQSMATDDAWDQAAHIGSRERRRIDGVCTVEPADILNARTFPDTVTQCLAPFDTHGQMTHPLLYLFNAGVRGRLYRANIPYRCLLPKGLDGLLVIGLGMSADRDALPVLRMQRDLQNLGYAAGCAAALAVAAGLPPARLSVRQLQEILVHEGILDPAVPGWQDNFPLPDAVLAEAVRTLPLRAADGHLDFAGLEKLCTRPDAAVPLLRAALAAATTPDARLAYAAALACLDDPAGVPELRRALETAPDWDQGWNWAGMSAFGRKFSFLDGCILMLARAGGREALPEILRKAAQLAADSAYSHFRAVALACETCGDPAAAPVLARLLELPGVAGHHIPRLNGQGVRKYGEYSSASGDTERNLCLRELALARALLNLGDCRGRAAAILRNYSLDPRGAYARHALLVLEGKKATPAREAARPPK